MFDKTMHYYNDFYDTKTGLRYCGESYWCTCAGGRSSSSAVLFLAGLSKSSFSWLMFTKPILICSSSTRRLVRQKYSIPAPITMPGISMARARPAMAPATIQTLSLIYLGYWYFFKIANRLESRSGPTYYGPDIGSSLPAIYRIFQKWCQHF